MKKDSEKPQERLSAVALKDALWDAFDLVKSGLVSPGQGQAVAAQGREILRTVYAQIKILQEAGRPIPFELVRFADPTAKPKSAPKGKGHIDSQVA
ncbi:MAG: hypothetical protein VW405_02550 [Rhodospirillaceae bacterium]